jgi:hypothetical protein
MAGRGTSRPRLLGLDPKEFDLEDAGGEVRIKHKWSTSCFTLGADPTHYVGRYVVGDGPDWPFEAYSWQAIIPRISRWLGEVKGDRETPDLWAEADGSGGAFFLIYGFWQLFALGRDTGVAWRITSTQSVSATVGRRC